jgi:plasmid stabilization system protein ParE
MPEYSVKLLGMAEDDLDEICECLSRFYPGTVGRFLEVLEESFAHAAYNPRMYQPYEWNKEYRRIVAGDSMGSETYLSIWNERLTSGWFRHPPAVHSCL